jgi:methionyl aminopeptidase
MGAMELADAVESLIRSRGAGCAFPVNIGVNEVAAHYSPSKDDDIRFMLGDVVKIDVGAHVDGYPADTSTTVEIGTRNNSALIACAEDALRMCIEMTAPGTAVSVLGDAVSRTIRAAGFRPIENLTGHSMERYSLHAGLSIPNIPTRDRAVIHEGMVVAIEPFSTTGGGRVQNDARGNIYRIVRDRRAPPEVTALFSSMRAAFGTFPFASRWCEALQPGSASLVQRMVRLGMIMNYPVLTEVQKGIVAQSEHSVVVTGDGCVVIT